MKAFTFTFDKLFIRIILAVFVSVLLALLQLSLVKEWGSPEAPQKNYMANLIDVSADEKSQRENITFIMGEDHENDNPYYTEALNYYRYNDSARTEYLVTNCYSLLEVRNFLEENHNSIQPWGTVNIVSHGNQWLGLSARISPDGKRATPTELERALENRTIESLPDSILDSRSEIFIHGCGVGNNESYLQKFAQLIGGDFEQPLVRASRLFEYYASISENNKIIESERYLAETWYTIYKKGYRPPNSLLTRELQTKYPDEALPWSEILTRDYPRWAGDTYHFTFEVPVKWVMECEEDSMPDFSDSNAKLQWIRNHPEIMAALKKINIPEDQFNWWFRKVYVPNEEGKRSSALWIKGYSTILCVIKPLVEEEKNTGNLEKPFHPHPEDAKYYGLSKPITKFKP